MHYLFCSVYVPVNRQPVCRNSDVVWLRECRAKVKGCVTGKVRPQNIQNIANTFTDFFFFFLDVPSFR